MRFEWDPKKESSNLKKHGVAFVEAAELLTSNEDFLEIYDEVHSESEERFIAIGPGRRGLILVVYAERDQGLIRIISARRATRMERELYRTQRGASR